MYKYPFGGTRNTIACSQDSLETVDLLYQIKKLKILVLLVNQIFWICQKPGRNSFKANWPLELEVAF